MGRKADNSISLRLTTVQLQQMKILQIYKGKEVGGKFMPKSKTKLITDLIDEDFEKHQLEIVNSLEPIK